MMNLSPLGVGLLILGSNFLAALVVYAGISFLRLRNRARLSAIQERHLSRLLEWRNREQSAQIRLLIGLEPEPEGPEIVSGVRRPCFVLPNVKGEPRR